MLAAATPVPRASAIAAAIASALCLAFGLAGFLGLRGVDGSTERAKANTEQVVRVRTIYADLLAADAAVTNGFLLGGQESAQNRQTYDEAMARPLTPVEARFADAEGFEDASQAVSGRCSMCHAREPVWDGIRTAPKGVLLETPADIARAAHQIYVQAGLTDAMPPANITGMEDVERDAILRWFREVGPLGVAGL